MTFRSEPALWMMAAVPLLLWLFLARERLRGRIARRFAGERLRGVSGPLRRFRPWLLALAAAASLLALAGPLAGFRVTPVVTRETNRVLVVDVSNSMAAEDVGTSRLAAAKALAIRLAAAQEGRTAVVVFEQVPEIVCPLTSDSDAVASLVDTLQPGEVGEPGSDLGGAVMTALGLLESDPGRAGDVVVISDGEDQRGRAGEAATRASARGIRISTILVGTPAGATIPTAGGPLRDESDQIVTTRAHPEEMHRLASGTGGKELVNPFAAGGLAELTGGMRGGTPSRRWTRTPIDRYQWPLAFAFVALLGASLLQRGAE